MGFFSSPFGLTRERLTRLSPSEPLSRLSLFVIVLLDIFVLFTLFQGLASVTGEIESPDERFPALCRGAFELGGAYPALASETEVDRRLRVAIDYADNSMYDSSSGTPESVCAQLESAARALRESNWFYAGRQAIRSAESTKYDALGQISRLEWSYSDSLLERIADQPRDASILPSDAGSTRADIQAQRDIITQADASIARAHVDIAALPEWTALWSLVDAHAPEARDAYASAEFWYPVLTLLVQMAFLAPVLLLAGLIYGWALRRGTGIATVLSAHLLVVAIIPIFIKVVEFALDLLPRHLLAAVMDFLDRYNIVVVFNYVLIIVAIIVTLGLVHLIQRRFFSLARLRAKRLEKGACTSCGHMLPTEPGIARYCLHCGESQVVSCDACGAETRRFAPHCGHCGASIADR